MTASERISTDANSPEHWERVWERHRRESRLKRTQRLSPEKWQAFYDRVSDIWDEMTGLKGRIGEAVAKFVADRRLAVPGEKVLDLGCGPGSLSLALAAQGFLITALDSSAGMIRALEEKIRLGKASGASGVKTVAADWKGLPREPSHDLVAACFFPEACSPEGLRRMESLSSGKCLLVLGDGRDAFPIRKKIWEKVMDEPLPKGDFNLTCAENYLRATGRRPTVSKLCLPALLDIPEDRAETYFREYFGIFGKTGPQVQKEISETLAPHCLEGSLRISGECHLALLWWSSYGEKADVPGENR